MSTQEFIKFFLFFIFLIYTYLGVGKLITQKLLNKIPVLTVFGINVLLGFGVVTYLSLIAGLFGYFNKPIIGTVFVLGFVISIFKTNKLIVDIKSIFLSIIKKSNKSYFSIILGFFTIFVLGAAYLSALQPPFAADELHYHLPEVRQIITTNKINLNFDGHYFYGNIPKIIEVNFAAVSLFIDYNFTHVANFVIFLSFLAIIGGLLLEKFGFSPMTYAIFLLATFDDLIWNATTGYIDTATLSFELSSLILLIYLLAYKFRESKHYIVPGLLMGLAISSKYSPLPTLLYTILVFLVFEFKNLQKKDRKRSVNKLLYYTIGIAFFGGFWYIKNLLLYQNPFYPLYFGHEGVDELTYKSLIDAIQQFGPKNIESFFRLVSHYKTINGLFVYISLFAGLFILLKKQGRNFTLPLVIFYFLYSLYWFYFATHQIRFLAPAYVISLMLFGLLISKMHRYGGVIVFGLFFVYIYLTPGFWNSYWSTKLQVVGRQYAIGNISKDQFLTRNFGCQYLVIRYLETNNLSGNVIDNWSVWHAPSVSFFANKNHFQTYGQTREITGQGLKEEIQQGRINYIYYNDDVKFAHLKNTDEVVVNNKKNKINIENFILRYSDEIYSFDKCHLFKINISKFPPNTKILPGN